MQDFSCPPFKPSERAKHTSRSSHLSPYSHNKQAGDQPRPVQTLNARLVNSFSTNQCSHVCSALRATDTARGNQTAGSFMQVPKNHGTPSQTTERTPTPSTTPTVSPLPSICLDAELAPLTHVGGLSTFLCKYHAFSAPHLLQAAEHIVTQKKGTDPTSVQLDGPHISQWH